MTDKIQKIIALVKKSSLDDTIKDILVRDLEKDGLNDFVKEQIKAYCLEERNKLNAEEAEALRILEEKSGQENPTM